MRLFAFLILVYTPFLGQAQDPDQQPYWMRYTFVEDTAPLIPLSGQYTVIRLGRGHHWTYYDPSQRGGFEDNDTLEIGPLFKGDDPLFRVTNSRGSGGRPDERLRVVRGLDTMDIYLPGMEAEWRSERDAFCKHAPCDRLPPALIPFRPGYHLRYWTIYGTDPAPRSVMRSYTDGGFSKLWREAVAADRLIPERLKDTMRYDVELMTRTIAEIEALPADAETWVMRSWYHKTHLLKLPVLGEETVYLISGGTAAGLYNVPLNLRHHSRAEEATKEWLDVSAWPPGDYNVIVEAGAINKTFTLKLR